MTMSQKLGAQVRQMVFAGALTALATAGFGCARHTSGESALSSQSALTIAADETEILAADSTTLTISGGTGTYTNVVATLGTVSSTGTKGVYTYIAPVSVSSSSQVIITATDSGGATGTATLLILGDDAVDTLSLSPLSPSLAGGAQQVFSVSGGSGSYLWQVSGGGTLSSASGSSVTYTAPSTSASVTLTVTDAGDDSLSASATITVTATHRWAPIGQLPSFGIGYCGSETPTTCTNPGTTCFIMAGNWKNGSQQMYNTFICQ